MKDVEILDSDNTVEFSQEHPLDAAIFGPMGTRTAKLCREVSTDLIAKQLPLMTPDEFSRVKDPAKLNEIYWRDILYRVYWAAGLNLRRHQRWQSGCITAFVNPANVLSFAANLRGLIEASLDASYSLGRIPATLANVRETIYAALEGGLKDKYYASKDLEDWLIHFVYARKLVGTEKSLNPESHVALKPEDYRKAIGLPEEHRKSFGDLYNELCGICHPTAFSFWPMWEETTEGHIRLKQSEDALMIQSLCQRYGKTIEFALSLSVTTSALCLKTLNCFPLPEVWCMPIERWRFENIPASRKLAPVLIPETKQ